MSRPAISYPIPTDEPPPLSTPTGYYPPPSPRGKPASFRDVSGSLSGASAPPGSSHHAGGSGSGSHAHNSHPGHGGGTGSGGSGYGGGPGGGYEGGRSGRQVSGPRAPSSTSTLDSYITRLLVVTKQLLQGLEQWARRELSEEAVSDIYVRLGNGFELCVSTFRRAGISTADLDSVPSDLREILERALAEEPTQDTLNIYLPDIRAIIFNLLNGLKNKQMAYKRHLVERTPQPEPVTPQRPQPRQSAPPADAETRSVRSIASIDGPASPASQTGILPSASSRPTLAERSQHRERASRPAPPDAFRPSRTRPAPDGSVRTLSSGSIERPMPRATSPIPSVHSGFGTPPTGPVTPAPTTSAPPARQPRRPERTSRDSANPTSRFSADSDVSSISSARAPSDSASASTVTMPIPIPHALSRELPLPPVGGSSHIQPTPSPGALPTATSPAPPPPPVPRTPPPPSPGMPGLPTLNLPDQGEDQGEDAVEVLNGVTAAFVNDGVHPAARSSFALLQRSDALERRASKRFSSYTFNKMVGTSPGKKATSGTGSPPRPARRSNVHAIPPMPALTEAHRSLVAETTPPVSEPAVSTAHSVDAISSTSVSASPPASTPGLVTAFLQLGRHVKKTTIELPLTMSALRLLFMERFEYDPGMEDFPDVYIKDPRTSVQYELEDMEDVREGCLLVLDIEPLDQVKQHFDLNFASLAQDIKELKTSLAQSKRMSTTAPSTSLLTVSPVLTAAPPPPPVETPRSPMRSDSGPAPVAELRAHYDEVQSLRRDLAIMRQLHVDFLSQTKESFAALRAQNTAMREVVKTKMGGNRSLLDNSKAKLEGQCQDTIQAVEEVSDIIDGAREDALRRGVTPPRGRTEKIKADLERATSLVDQFSRDVTLAEPTWRATWLAELQRVTDEQRLLAYQNKLAADLKNDIKDATEMLDNVRAFVTQRAVRPRFQPPPPETGGVTNLLLEIRTKESDPTARLRAIEEQAKVREREMASRTDDFQDELGAFVQGRKLRKTGGTDEAERVRQRRQDQTIRRMLSGDGPGAEPLSPQITGRSASAASNASSPPGHGAGGG
ncbi:uncharacterized protein CcaverHIS019_0702390 [Cutaneotrichosporon cavernicola]|uniref:Actin interacting protein 3 C-terminal domain-containing protein n=1 Tax=Cutaneotrichosporon cavernicola TaxID=279322 RepID=A0AA48L9W4_9TREE|nr:uncharacterized protein CcaverHIS019_0702390 [Cutaneotrichosporon cavernicola]BEI94658.1 hypothetical protein CcaverHIS019_0702390 [Cutaneotrichosporon cavernicola]BEJ02433.1 hypothetical protein CcaverHIS631_0702280 [Cutaneotrichosporon cavernicola]BEJ10192.1 hypothetical protein CcaverHIS641_0702270 [Cutaneotrichosporon cavernicola]